MRPERLGGRQLMRVFGGDGDGREVSVLAVHPGALSVDHYAGLAAALPSGTAVHVVDLEQEPEYFQVALDGGRTVTSIDRLATRTLEAVRARGALATPWTLLGWSFGGVVGHALTGLLAESEQPRRLVLLDSIAPVAGFVQPEDAVGHGLTLPWFCMYLAAKRGGTTTSLPTDFPGLSGDEPDEALETVLCTGLESGVLRPGTTLPGLRKVYLTYLEGLRRNNRLAAAHRPQATQVPLTLLRPERSLLTTPDPLGWSALSADLATGNTPGDHYSMLREPEALRRIASALTTQPAAM
jgi:thioesterase domain-containing protein